MKRSNRKRARAQVADTWDEDRVYGYFALAPIYLFFLPYFILEAVRKKVNKTSWLHTSSAGITVWTLWLGLMITFIVTQYLAIARESPLAEALIREMACGSTLMAHVLGLPAICRVVL